VIKRGNTNVVSEVLATRSDWTKEELAQGLAVPFVSGWPHMVKFLVEHGADVNQVNGEGQTVLMVSLGVMPDVNLVKLIIAKGADVNARDRQGTTALMMAGNLKDPIQREAIIRLLQEAGAK
jgi:uncharacterized protein